MAIDVGKTGRGKITLKRGAIREAERRPLTRIHRWKPQSLHQYPVGQCLHFGAFGRSPNDRGKAATRTEHPSNGGQGRDKVCRKHQPPSTDSSVEPALSHIKRVKIRFLESNVFQPLAFDKEFGILQHRGRTIRCQNVALGADPARACGSRISKPRRQIEHSVALGDARHIQHRLRRDARGLLGNGVPFLPT